jgi:hypothetical protein
MTDPPGTPDPSGWISQASWRQERARVLYRDAIEIAERSATKTISAERIIQAIIWAAEGHRLSLLEAWEQSWTLPASVRFPLRAKLQEAARVQYGADTPLIHSRLNSRTVWGRRRPTA